MQKITRYLRDCEVQMCQFTLTFFSYIEEKTIHNAPLQFLRCIISEAQNFSQRNVTNNQ